MSFAEIFSPGLRHWKEFQDEQATKELQVPATGPGPGDVTVDLDKGVIVIPQTPVDDAEQDVPADQSGPKSPDLD